jgi:hypothetical protein
MYEVIAVSDHIRLSPYTHDALEKGQPVVLASGALVGFADHAYEEDGAVEIDIGVRRSVFRAATADIAGSPAVGAAVYITADGDLSMDDGEGENFLTGIVTDVSEAVAFVKLG